MRVLRLIESMTLGCIAVGYRTDCRSTGHQYRVFWNQR
jgi:hypothetical protein